MKIKENRIDAIGKQYNISYVEVIGILYSSIATIYHAKYASFLNNEVLIGKLENRKIYVQTKKPQKRTIYNILKDFKKQLELKSFENNFFMFFSKNRFYRAKPVKVIDNRIYIEILGSDKAKLYNFFVYVNQLNYDSFLKIKEKIFFKKDNIFFVNILRPVDKNNILCSNLNEELSKMLFNDTYEFLKKKFNKDYKIVNLRIEIDYFIKQIRFFCSFAKSKKASFKFIGLLNRILNKRIGNVRIIIV